MERTQRPVVQPQTVTPASNSGIDYSIIKAIVKECLDEKLKENNSRLLEESNLKTISIKEGVIRLVDNSGNVFKARLEKAGNINDKKK